MKDFEPLANIFKERKLLKSDPAIDDRYSCNHYDYNSESMIDSRFIIWIPNYTIYREEEQQVIFFIINNVSGIFSSSMVSFEEFLNSDFVPKEIKRILIYNIHYLSG